MYTSFPWRIGPADIGNAALLSLGPKGLPRPIHPSDCSQPLSISCLVDSSHFWDPGLWFWMTGRPVMTRALFRQRRKSEVIKVVVNDCFQHVFSSSSLKTRCRLPQSDPFLPTQTQPSPLPSRRWHCGACRRPRRGYRRLIAAGPSRLRRGACVHLDSCWIRSAFLKKGFRVPPVLPIDQTCPPINQQGPTPIYASVEGGLQCAGSRHFVLALRLLLTVGWRRQPGRRPAVRRGHRHLRHHGRPARPGGGAGGRWGRFWFSCCTPAAVGTAAATGDIG